MPDVRAIETAYAGHRFRSRLEARWAVFFDTLGLRWQYEPEGFEIGMGGGDIRYYLPDFYLPDHETWVEVKGKIESDDLILLAACCVDPWSGPILPDIDTFSVRPPRNRDDWKGTSSGLLILGEIPPPCHSDYVVSHDFFTWYKGVLRYPHVFDTRGFGLDLRDLTNGALLQGLHTGGCSTYERYQVTHEYDSSHSGGDGSVLECMCHAGRCELMPYTLHNIERLHRAGHVQRGMDPAVLAAYDAARKARFEHGARGRR